MENYNEMTITEAVFNRFIHLEVVGEYLAENVTEKCYAVMYKGMVQYLSHKERVAIISGSGEDFDVVPSDFNGPEYEEKHSYNFIDHRSEHFYIATEWDGSKYPIYVEKVKYDGYLRCHMMVLYQNGTYTVMSQADFRVLVGKPIITLLHGRPTNPSEIIMGALMGIVRPHRVPNIDGSIDIPF